MTTTLTSPATHSRPGQKVKFVVSSAEEAVSLIRQEMGPQAKVLSVRQVEGKGLATFLTAPKLEVIATLPEEEKQKTRPQVLKPLLPAEETAGGVENAELPANVTVTSAVSGPKNSRPMVEQGGRLEQVLRAAGFENSIIRRFENSTDWKRLQNVPVKTALSDLARRLRMDYDAVEIPAATQMIAFIGGTGVGKTTALCKQLAHEVFFERRALQVMKLDGDNPNSDTALSLYCEVMGVPLIREQKSIEPTAALLIDTAGINLNDPEEVSALKKKLDAMGVKTRVFVLNAAYENSVLDRSLAIAEELECSHSVYTHLDEISSTSRLWQFVLSGRVPPLFGSNGPGVAHDRVASLGSVLLQKTFPEYLLK